jgi:hypothetical protein
MKLLSIKPSDRPAKKYTATFCMCEGETKCCDKDRKKVHFGAKGSSTYIDHRDEKKKDAYIARHRVNENFNNPLTAGSLARFILWNKTTLSASINDFKKRFKL